MTTKLAHQTQKTAGIPNGMRTATVAAVSSTAVTITVNGGNFTSGVGVVTSYAPKVGDVVAVFRQDSSWLILGPTSAVNRWQKMSALGYQNSWSDVGGGSPVGQYRICADEVKMVGQITNPVQPGNGQTIVSGLPAPSGPIVVIGAMTATRPRLQITAAGDFKIFDPSTSGTLQFCFAYPLDSLTA